MIRVTALRRLRASVAIRRPHTVGLSSLGWLLLLTGIWGASYMLIKIGVAAMPPITFASVRVAFGALVVAAIVGAQRLLVPHTRADWRGHLFMGFSTRSCPSA